MRQNGFTQSGRWRLRVHGPFVKKLESDLPYQQKESENLQ
jgi:hypothetical protein